MRAHGLRLASALLLSGLALGCLSTAKETEIGAEEAKNVAASIGLVQDSALVDYVAAVGARVAAHAKRVDVAYQFFVADMQEPNAFALPGGFIYVTRGLLALVNSEDELAGVLGHEIGHVEARHSVKRVVLASPFAIATGLAGFAAGIVSPTLGRVVAGTTGAVTEGLVVAPFSRSQERQADAIGLGLAASAGYEPAALSTFLETLGREGALQTGKEESFHFLASHPTTPERVRKTAERAGGMTPGAAAPIAQSRGHFLEKLDGLLVGPDPAAGVFQENVFLHPLLDFTVSFPPGWKTVNTRQAVYGADPTGTAVVSVEIAGAGSDPAEPLRRINEESRQPLEGTPVKVGSLSGVRSRVDTRTERGIETVDVTWLAYDGNIYQVTGAAPRKQADGFLAPIRSVSESFRRLTPAELRSIREVRLRIARARKGETIPSLVERVKSVWPAERVAVANALATDASLEANQPLKVPVEEVFKPRS